MGEATVVPAFHDLCALIEVDAQQVLDRIGYPFDQST